MLDTSVIVDQTENEMPDIQARVKWFNATKGFGFVQAGEKLPDAFLHISVLERAGHRSLPEGAELICDLTNGDKGLQVKNIHRVESIPEPPPPPGSESGEPTIEGIVKFFNADKGYGFVSPDDGSRDIFISARILERSGIYRVTQNQRIKMETEDGDKGPLATIVQLLE
ncbi:cold-shock protein [uncultured Kiloniella sp.]|uniref:cold-shock protein n=1 Tax=Kiloniella sp. TaxID=1938587 RepID=UPI00260B6256|nr:cold-shock protein [uncultured Kiloniella sp.]